MKPQERRQQNILTLLDRHRSWFGIPHAYCSWYLDNPQYKQVFPFNALYDRMLTLDVDTEMLKLSAKLAKKRAADSFNQSHTFLEDKLVPAGMKEQLTPEEIARSYQIGKWVGIGAGTIVLYLIFRHFFF